jgi:hypothetical protein
VSKLGFAPFVVRDVMKKAPPVSSKLTTAHTHETERRRYEHNIYRR